MHNVLVIDLLGPNLEDLFDMCGRKFTIKTVCMAAKQMVSIYHPVVRVPVLSIRPGLEHCGVVKEDVSRTWDPPDRTLPRSRCETSEPKCYRSPYWDGIPSRVHAVR